VVSEILLLAKQEELSRQSDRGLRPAWKRELEGTVGGYWGLIDSVQRAVKYPPMSHQQLSVLGSCRWDAEWR